MAFPFRNDVAAMKRWKFSSDFISIGQPLPQQFIKHTHMDIHSKGKIEENFPENKRKSEQPTDNRILISGKNQISLTFPYFSAKCEKL